jgi:hypothetical protein
VRQQRGAKGEVQVGHSHDGGLQYRQDRIS